MSAYAIIHDQNGRVRCCNADGGGGAPYDSEAAARFAINHLDRRAVIRVCDHPHHRSGSDYNWRRCARTDKPCAIQP